MIVNVNTAFLAREKKFDVHCDWRFDEQDNNKLINWKDYRVKECIDYNRSYAYKAVEYLEYCYDHIFDNNDKGYYLSAPCLLYTSDAADE